MVAERTAFERPGQLILPPPLPQGLDAWTDAWVGRVKRRRVVATRVMTSAAAVLDRESVWSGRSDADLDAALDALRERFRRRRVDDAQLFDALAGVREVARRTLGLHPYSVQIAGAIALHRGYLAEMATGEGKSLTAAVAAVLAGWSRRPCHVVTVNDYLAERDREKFEPFYRRCGLSVGAVVAGAPAEARRAGHAADITYTTGKELAGDLLRDQLALRKQPSRSHALLMATVRGDRAEDPGTVLRGLHTAIVDEADSVLIDEAVTPLIIAGHSGRENQEAELYQWGAAVSDALAPAVHYRVDPRRNEAQLTVAGRLEVQRRIANARRDHVGARLLEIVEQAVTAREFFQRGRQYVSQDDRVTIVDEFTGRLMPHRKWRAGLHQVIEAREGVTVTPVDDTLARISFQTFFRLFRRLSGMSGTVWEVAPEAWRMYRLPVVRIPTHRPCVRRELPDRIFRGLEEKWRAISEEIANVHAAGRPVLVGTRTIADSQKLESLLRERQLTANLLNGVQTMEEARVIAAAGQPGQITIATNMAGRGTDIELGSGVAAKGGLHVIATERHASRRIDRQLYGRAGRQGDPGSSQAFVSLEDELLRRHVPAPLLRAVQAAGPRGPWARAAFPFAQARAEAWAGRQRLAVMRQDDWLEDALSFARR